MNPAEYLNAAKIALDAPTDYALAKAMDVPTQRISDWYKGKAPIHDEGAAKLALVLELPIGEVLADLRSQDAKTDKAREFWRSFLARTRSTALTAALLIFGAFYGYGLPQYAGDAGRFRGRMRS